MLVGLGLLLGACTPVSSSTEAYVAQARERTLSSRPVPAPPPQLYVEDALIERPGFPWCDDPHAHEARGDEILLFRRGCAPSLSEPAVFFDEQVLVRLPSSLQNHTVEHTPSFARSAGDVEHPGCVEDHPGPLIQLGALGVVEAEGELAGTLKDLVATLGYPEGTSMRIVEQRDGVVEVVLNVPATHDTSEPAMAWLAVHERGSRRAWVVFESHPNAFNALVRSFACSSRSLLVLAGP